MGRGDGPREIPMASQDCPPAGGVERAGATSHKAHRLSDERERARGGRDGTRAQTNSSCASTAAPSHRRERDGRIHAPLAQR
eukprot:scaffold1061_cov213-Prasinococcus_capsulatus_cf.AAC.15